MKPRAFIFIGRYGAGKGTQAKLLVDALMKADEKHKTIYIETGAEFRKFIDEEGYTAKLSKKTVESGGLMPEFMPIYLWGKIFVENYIGDESIVFDGTPRKLMEAKVLGSLFPFYGFGKPTVIYLDVEHEESTKRISSRHSSQGRVDDTAEAIQKRKEAYEADVIPTIEWYKTNPEVNFLDIDGERSIEDIHEDIVKRIGLV